MVSRLIRLVLPASWGISKTQCVWFLLVVFVQFGSPAYYVAVGAQRCAGNDRRSAPSRSVGCDRVCRYFTSECVGPLRCPSATIVLVTIASPFPYVVKVAAMRCHVHAIGPLTEEVGRRSFSPWHHQVVASSHRLCAKLRIHCSGGWERIVWPLFVGRDALSLLDIFTFSISI